MPISRAETVADRSRFTNGTGSKRRVKTLETFGVSRGGRPLFQLADRRDDEWSLDAVLHGIRCREEWAAAAVCNRFERPLIRYFRRRFRASARPVVDEVGLAWDVLAVLCLQVRAGRPTGLGSWAELWSCAARIARSEFANHRRGEECLKRRASRRVSVAGNGLNAVPDPTHSPVAYHECEEEMLALVRAAGDAQLLTIVQLRMAGYTKNQVAGFIGASMRTVNRKLRFLLEDWKRSPPPGGGDCKTACMIRQVNLAKFLSPAEPASAGVSAAQFNRRF